MTKNAVLKTPLRRSLEWLTEQGGYWSIQDAVVLSGYEEAQVKRFHSELVRRRVLTELCDGKFAAGVNAIRWRLTAPKTRPGGHSKDYQEKARVRALVQGRSFAIGRGFGDGLTKAEIRSRMAEQEAAEKQAPADVVVVEPTPYLETPPVTITTKQAAKLMNVCRLTVVGWIRSGKLPAMQTGTLSPTGRGGTRWRIDPKDLASLISEKSRKARMP